MNIDTQRLAKDRAYWDSVAPDGATHYQPHQHMFYKRIEEDEWRVRSKMFNDKYHWFNSPGTSDDALWVKRPTGWSGTGLPPVGTECGMSLGGSTRPKVCITYIGQGVFCYMDMNSGNEYTGATRDATFIARKTQAQREREEVISTAHALLIDTDTDRTVDGTLAALYDAGMLRKKED